MIASTEQIRIAKAVLNAFLPLADHTECVDRATQAILNFGLQTSARVAVREAIREISKQPDDERLNLCIKTAHSLIWGYVHWIDAQADEITINCNPAWEFHQIYQRNETVDWIQRWQESGGKVFQQNRMIALINSPIWAQISFWGLPFQPFDLDSGMGVDVVPRNEAEELGLLKKTMCFSVLWLI